MGPDFKVEAVGITKDNIQWLGAAAGLILAFVFVAPYKAWKSLKLEADESKEKRRPKLRCSFDLKDPACVRPGVTIQFIPTESWRITTTFVPARQPQPAKLKTINADLFRLRVETENADLVEACRGRLVQIEFLGSSSGNRLGEPLLVPFSPGSHADALAKTIRAGSPEYLDVLYITRNDKVMVATHNLEYPSSIPFDDLFESFGEYRLRVELAAMKGVAVHCDLLLKWNGDRETAAIRQLGAP
jgi:hypothetical protein